MNAVSTLLDLGHKSKSKSKNNDTFTHALIKNKCFIKIVWFIFVENKVTEKLLPFSRIL